MRSTRKACLNTWEKGSIYAPGTGSSRSRGTRQTNPIHARDARVSDIIRNRVTRKKTRLFTWHAADTSFRNVQTHNRTRRKNDIHSNTPKITMPEEKYYYHGCPLCQQEVDVSEPNCFRVLTLDSADAELIHEIPRWERRVLKPYPGPSCWICLWLEIPI